MSFPSRRIEDRPPPTFPYNQMSLTEQKALVERNSAAEREKAAARTGMLRSLMTGNPSLSPSGGAGTNPTGSGNGNGVGAGEKDAGGPSVGVSGAKDAPGAAGAAAGNGTAGGNAVGSASANTTQSSLPGISNLSNAQRLWGGPQPTRPSVPATTTNPSPRLSTLSTTSAASLARDWRDTWARPRPAASAGPEKSPQAASALPPFPRPAAPPSPTQNRNLPTPTASASADKPSVSPQPAPGVARQPTFGGTRQLPSPFDKERSASVSEGQSGQLAVHHRTASSSSAPRSPEAARFGYPLAATKETAAPKSPEQSRYTTTYPARLPNAPKSPPKPAAPTPYQSFYQGSFNPAAVAASAAAAGTSAAALSAGAGRSASTRSIGPAYTGVQSDEARLQEERRRAEERQAAAQRDPYYSRDYELLRIERERREQKEREREAASRRQAELSQMPQKPQAQLPSQAQTQTQNHSQAQTQPRYSNLPNHPPAAKEYNYTPRDKRPRMDAAVEDATRRGNVNKKRKQEEKRAKPKAPAKPVVSVGPRIQPPDKALGWRALNDTPKIYHSVNSAPVKDWLKSHPSPQTIRVDLRPELSVADLGLASHLLGATVIVRIAPGFMIGREILGQWMVRGEAGFDKMREGDAGESGVLGIYDEELMVLDDDGKRPDVEDQMAYSPYRMGAVWGTEVYTDDSHIAEILIHDDWIRWEEVEVGPEPREDGIEVTLRLTPPLSRYVGTIRRMAKSRGWGNGHDGFSVIVESIKRIKGYKTAMRGRKGAKARMNQLNLERRGIKECAVENEEGPLVIHESGLPVYAYDADRMGEWLVKRSRGSIWRNDLELRCGADKYRLCPLAGMTPTNIRLDLVQLHPDTNPARSRTSRSARSHSSPSDLETETVIGTDIPAEDCHWVPEGLVVRLQAKKGVLVKVEGYRWMKRPGLEEEVEEEDEEDEWAEGQVGKKGEVKEDAEKAEEKDKGKAEALKV